MVRLEKQIRFACNRVAMAVRTDWASSAKARALEIELGELKCFRISCVAVHGWDVVLWGSSECGLSEFAQ